MHSTTKKITVIIPCKNEAAGVSGVIQNLPYNRARALGISIAPLVVDNASTDGTGQCARDAGATVVREDTPGKGNAMRTGFAHIPKDTNYVVMVDGDGTYAPEDLLRLVEPLESGFCDVVLGSRLAGKMTPRAMSVFNRVGNWGFSFLVRLFYRVNVTDVLTGYFAWRKDALSRLVPYITETGFGLEMDMVTKMAKLHEEVYSVPIQYKPRAGTSHLHPIRDGLRILWVFTRNFLFFRCDRRPVNTVHMHTTRDNVVSNTL